ncbi:MAG: glutathione S-transferase C-terminal domain-containing protein, partial [Dokdonella sp.]
HYWPTPNGHKIVLLLEEAGLDYALKPVNIGKGEQFEPAFLVISPNNRMPAIVDHAPTDGGAPISVFESGAILQYLAEKAGQFLSSDPRRRVETLEWLYWQVGGQGPMTGQYGHFNVYAPEKIGYAIERYTQEVLRLFGVLERRLATRAFLTGSEYSIADMACYPWINPYKTAPIDLEPFPQVRRWRAEIAARPATIRAYAQAKRVDPDAGKALTEEEKRNLFGRQPDSPHTRQAYP